MARRPALTAKKVVRLLKERGFQEVRQKGSHLLLMHPETKKRAIVPIHPKDLPRGTLLQILKEAGIDWP